MSDDATSNKRKRGPSMLLQYGSVCMQYGVIAAIELIITLILWYTHRYFPIVRFPIVYALIVLFSGYIYGVRAGIFASIVGFIIYCGFILRYGYEMPMPRYELHLISGCVAYLLCSGIAVFAIIQMHKISEVTNQLDRRSAERDDAECARRESEERYRKIAASAELERNQLEAVINSMNQGVMILDSHGRIIKMNPAALRFFQCTASDVENNRLDALCAGFNITTLDGSPAPSIRDLVKQVMSGQRIENLELRATGLRYVDTFIGSFSALPVLNKDGEIMLVVVLISDITERIAAEEREREFERQKTEFYRRTILAATNGKLEVLDEASINEIAGEALKTWQINDASNLITIRHEIATIAAGCGMDNSRIDKFIMSIGEAVGNVFKYAGSGEASIHKLPNGLLFKVSDHGSGIDAMNLPDLALRDRYSTAGTLGMGYKVMLSFCNKVYFATGTAGTTVALMMYYTDDDGSPKIEDVNIDD